jgi:hypothetical protein
MMTKRFTEQLATAKTVSSEKKSKEEIDHENAIKTVEKAAGMFAWNVDKAFTDLMTPILDAYIRDAGKIIDWSYKFMNRFERWYCNKCDQKQKETPLYMKIKAKRKKQYKAKLLEVRKAFYDMQIEESEKWNKEWDMKPLLKVEYDNIPIEPKTEKEKVFAKKYGKLSEMRIKPKYVVNQKKNHKIFKYNNKRRQICYKWRKEQLRWFVDNLASFWY